MKFNSLDELPENGSLVWVKLPGERAIVRLYNNDSFGLGDRDFDVNGWAYYRGQASLNYMPESNPRAWGRTFLGSSELSLNLVR